MTARNRARIYQVTDDQRTWYVAYGDEGRIARVNAQGEIVRNPVLLSDRPRNAEGFEDGDRVTYESLPGEVKRTAGAEMGQRTEVLDVRKISRGGTTVYRIDFDEGASGRTLFIDESGKLRREIQRDRRRPHEGQLRRVARPGEEHFGPGQRRQGAETRLPGDA